MTNYSSKPTQKHSSANSLLDRFEEDLRSGGLSSVADYFPPITERDAESTIGEILRITLEWAYENGKANPLDTILDQHSWIQQHPLIIGPLAFEDFRLRMTNRQPVNRKDYERRLGISTKEWDQWLSNCDLESECHYVAQEQIATQANHWSSTTDNASAADESSIASSNDSPLNIRASLPFPSPGEKFGEFTLVQCIGEGGFSRVYLARQGSLANRPIALKIASTPLGESQRLARLQHSNIMPLLFAQTIQGFYVLGMPLLGLTTVKELIQSHWRTATTGVKEGLNKAGLNKIDATGVETRTTQAGSGFLEFVREKTEQVLQTVPEAIPYSGSSSDPNNPLNQVGDHSWEVSVLKTIYSVAEGLHYAHCRGVQHRDIKPANILLGFDGQPFLLDFNLGRVADWDDRIAYRSVGGTLPYMAPEHLDSLIHGNESLSNQCDVYSLGVVLYQLLSGDLPHNFDGITNGDLLAAQSRLADPVFPLRHRVPQLSFAAEAIVSKCLERSPQLRYQSAQDLATDIRLHLTHRPLKYAKNTSLPERIGKLRRRHPALASAGSVALAMIGVSIVLFTLFNSANHRIRTLQANRLYEQFVRKSHEAEAQLFFADGGSRENGKLLVAESLALVGANATTIASPDFLNYLSDSHREDTLNKIDYLHRLVDSESGVNAETLRSSQDASRLSEATRAYFDRHLEKAVGLLDEETLSDPKRFVAWFLKGKCHFELKEYQEANHCYSVAGFLEPNLVTPQIAQGACLYQLNRFEFAEDRFARAHELAPNNFSAIYNLALVCEKQNRLRDALEYLDQADAVKPGSARVLMARSRIARALGDTAEADSALQSLILSDPHEPEGWVLRGIAHLPSQPEQALKDFEKAEQWDNTRFIAGQNKASVLSEYLKRPDEAIEVLTDLIDQDSRFYPALSGRAVLYARLGKQDLAIQDVKRSLEISPTPQIHYQAACVYALLLKQDPSLVNEALNHLALATTPAYGGKILGTDSDLDNLRTNPVFKSILKGVTSNNQHGETR